MVSISKRKSQGSHVDRCYKMKGREGNEKGGRKKDDMLRWVKHMTGAKI